MEVLGRFQTFHSFVYRTDILYIIKKYVDLVRIKYLRVFPMPIILSLLLNEVTNKRLKTDSNDHLHPSLHVLGNHCFDYLCILNVDGGY